MEDEGVILGAALGLKDGVDSLRIQPVGPQAVDRFSRDAHKTAGGQDPGSPLYVVGGQALGFHLRHPIQSKMRDLVPWRSMVV